MRCPAELSLSPIRSSRTVDLWVRFRFTLAVLMLWAPIGLSAQQSAIAPVHPVTQSSQPSIACPRPKSGETITNPPELRSSNGLLEVTLHLRYQQTMVVDGPPRYCYVTDDGQESPTLRVFPGDRLVIHLHNDLPEWTGYRPPRQNMQMTAHDDCDGGVMDSGVTNLHFHGMNIPAVCHQDEVIRTAIAAGKQFDYRITIPRNQPPGLYWYHPHPHGYSERQVQGGASGAIIVEGIEKVAPAVASLPQRVLMLRDQQRIGPEAPAPTVPTWDLSANFVPITYTAGEPAVLEAKPGQREFWRVVNAGADVIMNLKLMSGGVPQAMQIVAVDGVPVAKTQAAQTNIVLGPGARAEFIVTPLGKSSTAELVTEAWDTGPEGDNDTQRTIANVVSSTGEDIHQADKALRSAVARRDAIKPPPETGFIRRLYFSQRSNSPQDPDNFVLYFVTLLGEVPKVYEMGSPPNIVAHQGDVEDWIVENRSPEDHVFHIHQIHFRTVEVNGKPVNDTTLRDTIDVPYWKGSGPYPSVKLRMDFRDPNTVGTFLYHCHILKHEDMGMMGSIEVLPPAPPTATQLKLNPPSVAAGDTLNVVAAVTPDGATGSMQFVVDGLDFGRPIALAHGHATLTTSFSDAGRHNITAIYSGDKEHDESVSPVASINVRE